METEKYFIAIDKGTYDAISLIKDDPKMKRYLYKKYLCSILEPGSYFIIASCNWTEKELADFFLEEHRKKSNFNKLCLNLIANFI